MEKKLPSISPAYKKRLSGAIVSVITFFVFYLLLILIGVLLIILLSYIAYRIFSIKAGYYTALLALAIFGVGISVFYYLIKFIFIKSNYDRSNAVEVNEKGQPELFQIINDIVKKTNTQRPKKVFINAEVNASVSYNSMFWSLFLPAKKNLTIGLGLINSTSVGELRSILAHEFGHFSQKSMVVGGYVNQAQRIIYDTVYNNKNYENDLIHGSSFWAWKIMGAVAVGVIKVMQYFLKLMSEFLFKNHASLSREMEYHADAISTFVTNPKEQISSLLRLELSSVAFNNALQYYIDSAGIYKTKNLYENQSQLIRKYAISNNHRLVNDLPVIDVDDVFRYNTSKIKIEDAFASHPETEDRIEKILKNEFIISEENTNPSKELFNGYENLCEVITKKIFISAAIKNIGEFISDEDFYHSFNEKYPELKISSIYNGYYNQHEPYFENLSELINSKTNESLETLFNDEKVSNVYLKNGAQSDLNLLEILSKDPEHIKTFRYDNILYKVSDATALISRSKNHLEITTQKVQDNDRNIFIYFYQNADESEKIDLKTAYEKLIKGNREFDMFKELHSAFANHLQFISITLPFDEIRKHRANLLKKEKSFKLSLKEFMTQSTFSENITEEGNKLFSEYLDASFIYFEKESYKNDELDVLFAAYNTFSDELSDGFFILKQNLLIVQEQIANKMDLIKK